MTERKKTVLLWLLIVLLLFVHLSLTDQSEQAASISRILFLTVFIHNLNRTRKSLR